MKISKNILMIGLITALVLAATLTASAGERTWTTGGPPGGIFDTIAVDPTAPGTVYVNVGTTGVWKTTDGGATWANVFNRPIQSIAINPTNTSIVYAGASVSGYSYLYKSADGGGTWAVVPGSGLGLVGDPVEQILQLTFQPGTGNLYALTSHGVAPSPPGNVRFRLSTDGGVTWSTSPVLTPSITMFAIDPSAPSTIYIAGKYDSNCCLYKSSDGGATFGADLMGLGWGKSYIAVAPTSSAILYAATTSGVRKSTNAGATWANTALTDPNVTSLLISPTSSSTVYAASGAGLYRTTDGGATWATVSVPSFSHVTSDVSFAPSDTSIMYASTYSGFFSSSNSGATWMSAADGISQTIGETVAASGSNPNLLFGGTVASGLFRSDDAGTTWQLTSSGLPGVDVFAIAVHPANDSIEWLGTSNGLYKTTNGGASWYESDTGIPAASNGERAVRELVVDPGNGAVLYAAIDGVGVYKTNNGGANWSSASTGLPSSFAGALAIDPNSTFDLYWGGAATASGAIYSSVNGGTSWAVLSVPTVSSQMSAIAVDPTASSRIFAGYFSAGLYRTTDSGATWTKATTLYSSIKSLRVDPVSGAIFAATNGGVQRSVDHGATWTIVGFGSGPSDTTDLVITRQDQAMLRITASAFRPGGFWDYYYSAPVLTAGSAPAEQPIGGVSASFGLGSFTDGSSEGPWMVTVNWNDGTPNDVFQVNTSGTIGTRTHTYAYSGTFVVHTIVTNRLALSGSANFSLTVAPPTLDTSTTLNANVNPSVFGQAVTFTATVTTVAPGSGTPAGTVTFTDGTTTIGTATLNGGTASVTTSDLTLGSHTIVAAYAGAGNFNASTSSPVAQTVNQAQTTTNVISTVNPSVFGQAVTFTATVTTVAPGSGTPAGTVTFTDGTTTIGTATLNGGTASVTTGTLGVGSHSITASYGGDGNFKGSTSGALADTVNRALSLTTLSVSVSPSVVGQPVTFTAAVGAVAPGSGLPGGTVTFTDGMTTVGTATLSSGTAIISTSSLAAGSHTITATYAGDGNFNGSSSANTLDVTYALRSLYDTTKAAKSGSTVPIKLQITDFTGLNQSSPSLIVTATALTKISEATLDLVIDDAGNANPDSNFRYDATIGATGGYIFNLKTTNLTTGTYALTFKVVADPADHQATFMVR